MRGGIVEGGAGGLIWFAWTSLEKAGFRHGFTARPGGASRGAFASLNFTSRQGDRADRVLENWRRLEVAAGLPEKWGLVRQVHGATVSRRLRGRRATESRESCVAADAVMTGSGRIALGILTADCLPLILAVEGTGFFSVVHAGWQGTLRGIAAGAARQLAAAAGAGTEDVTALIGPSIGRCCYQVGQEVFGAFDREWGGSLRRAFRRTDPWHLDLKAANRMQLREAGLRASRIGVVDLCTCCRRDLFFSHRRDGFRTGRMLAFATAALPPLPGLRRRG
jgi:YfiH family protein